MPLSPSATTPNRSLAVLAAALAASVVVALTTAASGGMDVIQHYAGPVHLLETQPVPAVIQETGCGKKALR